MRAPRLGRRLRSLTMGAGIGSRLAFNARMPCRLKSTASCGIRRCRRCRILPLETGRGIPRRRGSYCGNELVGSRQRQSERREARSLCRYCRGSRRTNAISGITTFKSLRKTPAAEPSWTALPLRSRTRRVISPVTALLRREGCLVNHQRFERLWRQERLKASAEAVHVEAIVADRRIVHAAASRPNMTTSGATTSPLIAPATVE